MVPPGQVVGGARREHLDVGVARQPFRYVSRVKFRASADVRAVALNHDGKLH